jgi:hypothetical protein
MKTIFVRKLDLNLKTLLIRAILTLLICCSIFVFIDNSISDEKNYRAKNISQLDGNKIKISNVRESAELTLSNSQVDLRKMLLERSQKYLESIENNKSISDEMKKRLKEQAQKVIESKLKNLINSNIVCQNSSQLANGQFDAKFFADVLNKICLDDNSQSCENQKSENKKSIVLKAASNNALRALSFLQNHYSRPKKIHTPTVYEVALRVAIPDNIVVVKNTRHWSRHNPNSNSLDGKFACGAIGCNDIISTSNRHRDLKAFAQLLEKNIKSITASIDQTTVFSFTNSITDRIIATSILIAKTTVLRN